MNQRTQKKYDRLVQERDQILYHIDCSEAPTELEKNALLSINKKISNLKISRKDIFINSINYGNRIHKKKLSYR